MRILDPVMAVLARQLGHPSGPGGRLVAAALNRANRRAVLAAVAATELEPGQVGADLGFGGGVGVRALLDRVGPHGRVQGVELSDTALAAARRRFRAEMGDGRLQLQSGDLTDLPLVDGSVDAAITVNTLYFVDQPKQAFRELVRVLQPGGRAVVGVGDPEGMRARPFTAHGFRLRPVADLMAMMRDAGLTDVTDQRVGSADHAFHLLVGRRPDRSD